MNSNSPATPANLIQAVESTYGSIARRELQAPSDTKDSSAKKVATAFGYSSLDLDSLPDGANMGLSCGNPVGVASIKEGETVVDLGSGGGLDVLLAAPKVGPTGKVIGLDMSEDMLTLARRNANTAGYSPPHVQFIKTVLPDLPVEANSVDLVISNCALNLLPPSDKPRVWAEIGRVLRSGGRVAISDILAKRELPDAMREDVTKWTGCISGASLVEEYKNWIGAAGFSDVQIIATGADLSIYAQVPGLTEISSKAGSCCGKPAVESVSVEKPCSTSDSSTCGSSAKATGCCSPAKNQSPSVTSSATSTLPAAYDVNDYVGSFLILAVKP